MDFFGTLAPNEAAIYLREVLYDGIGRFIPQRTISCNVSSQSWVTDRCLSLVKAKNEAFGTPQHEALSYACSMGMKAEYQAYLNRTRHKLQNLPKGSKRWWELTNILIEKPTKNTSFLSIKSNTNS